MTTAVRLVVPLLLALPSALPSAARAQTEYYDTDRGRPTRVEDAYAIAQRAVELQAAPLRLERSASGAYRWALEPQVALGVLPRTQLEVGAPLVVLDAGPRRQTTGLAGVDVSVLHTLNVETSLPAFGIRADALLPAGAFGPDSALASLTALATKSWPWGRVHVNGGYTFGDARPARAGDLSRWSAGVAADHAFPLRALLVTGELFAERPLGGLGGDAVVWNAGAGSRYQLTPRWAIDGGVGRRLTGTDPAWSLTAGGAWTFGLPWGAR
jgi:hypothetical protein